MDLSRVEVVLVRPARAANVAAACRAMKNMGLRRLWLVDPPPALLEHEARALAYGAWDVLDGASRAGGLGEAVAGILLREGVAPKFRHIGLPDAFLAAGALPTLHDRYGISAEAMSASIKGWL
jgi:transketolase